MRSPTTFLGPGGLWAVVCLGLKYQGHRDIGPGGIGILFMRLVDIGEYLGFGGLVYIVSIAHKLFLVAYTRLQLSVRPRHDGSYVNEP